MFFLIPKNVTSEKPLALMPTLIRWWEALRAPAVARLQLKYRVEWDAADGRNGGAQQTEREILMGRQKVLERVSLPVVWACGCYAGTSSIRSEYSSKDVRRNRSRPSRPSCKGPSGVVCFCVLHCKMR